MTTSGARRGALLLLTLLSLLAAAPADAARALQQAEDAGAPTLALNATRLAAAGDWLKVSWSGVADACASDFLALLPDGGTLDKNSPLKMTPTSGTRDGNARCVARVREAQARRYPRAAWRGARRAGASGLLFVFPVCGRLLTHGCACVRAQLPHAQPARRVPVVPLPRRTCVSSANGAVRGALVARRERANRRSLGADGKIWRDARAVDHARRAHARAVLGARARLAQRASHDRASPWHAKPARARRAQKAWQRARTKPSPADARVASSPHRARRVARTRTPRTQPRLRCGAATCAATRW